MYWCSLWLWETGDFFLQFPKVLAIFSISTLFSCCTFSHGGLSQSLDFPYPLYLHFHLSSELQVSNCWWTSSIWRQLNPWNPHIQGQTPCLHHHTSSYSITTVLLTIQANTQHFVLTNVDFIIVDSGRHHIFLSLLFGHSVVSDSFVTSGTVGAHQAPLCVGLSRQEYWRGLPFPTPQGIFPTHGLNPRLLHCRIVYCWVTCLHF